MNLNELERRAVKFTPAEAIESAIERFNNLTPDLLQQLSVQLPCVVVGFNQQDSTRDSAVIEEPRLHRYTARDLKQPTLHSVASGSLHRNGVLGPRIAVCGRRS